MKKSEVLKSFQTFMTQKDKDLDEGKILYEVLHLDVEEIRSEYHSNFCEAKEELSKSSKPLDFYQTLNSCFHEYVLDVLCAETNNTELPDTTYIDNFVDVFIEEILKDVEWEDEA